MADRVSRDGIKRRYRVAGRKPPTRPASKRNLRSIRTATTPTARLRYLATLFFPRSQRLLAWTVRLMSPREARYRGSRSGFTYSDTRLIRIHPDRVRAPQHELDVLLLHELVHASGAPGHGAVFLARLRCIARRAGRFGMEALAQQVHAEAQAYARGAIQHTAAAVYRQIASWIEDDGHRWSWTETREALCLEQCLLPEEILEKFPRARKVWARATREAAKMRTIRRKSFG